MLNNIKSTLKHSGIYSIGNIASKLIGVILLPLYTKHITVSEYGVLGILEITIMILTQVLILGQSQTLIRFHNLEEYKEKRRSTLFTIFIFLFSIGFLFNLIGQNFVTKLASLFFEPTGFATYFRLCFYIIFLRIINNLFLSVLRAKEKSRSYVISNIIKITLVLGFNIYFIAFAQIGVKGILYSYLIGDSVLFCILLPKMLTEMSAKFDKEILKAALIFGFPLIFSSLAGMLLNMGDRFILKLLVNYKEVGLYNLGYKIAGIINMLLIQSFTLGFLPMAYKMYGQKNDMRYYSKVHTYFVYVLLFSGLGLALFGKEIIKVLTLNSDYWNSFIVVPYIILAYVFSGAKSSMNTGLFLKGKTSHIAFCTIGAAILNLILNFLLIPRYKMMGAAVATLISFIILYLVTYFIVKRFYKIKYENIKLLKMLFLSIILFLISTSVSELNFIPRVLIKFFITMSFPLILYFLKFYEEIELIRIKQTWQKWRDPRKWRKNINYN
jgi:O-antigen/teichoic acid export membrane protein